VNNGERDEVVYRLFHPVTGAEIGLCTVEALPAEILRFIQLLGQAPRIVVIDRQKEDI